MSHTFKVGQMVHYKQQGMSLPPGDYQIVQKDESGFILRTPGVNGCRPGHWWASVFSLEPIPLSPDDLKPGDWVECTRDIHDLVYGDFPEGTRFQVLDNLGEEHCFLRPENVTGAKRWFVDSSRFRKCSPPEEKPIQNVRIKNDGSAVTRYGYTTSVDWGHEDVTGYCYFCNKCSRFFYGTQPIPPCQCSYKPSIPSSPSLMEQCSSVINRGLKALKTARLSKQDKLFIKHGLKTEDLEWTELARVLYVNALMDDGRRTDILEGIAKELEDAEEKK